MPTPITASEFRSEPKSQCPPTDGVTAAVRQIPQLSGLPIQCRLDGRVLFIRGSVRSFYQKQAASRGAAGLAGIERVINELEVDIPRWNKRARHVETEGF